MNAKCHSSTSVLTTDSANIISHGPNLQQVNLLFTKEDQESTVIPLTEHQSQYTKHTILKQGLVLCTRTEEWYTKKKTTIREVQLRKTRLRWRQFKAVLKPNQIELYHVTNILITTSQLAHVIYLNNKYPYRRVGLSLISPQDYIWCLQFLHYETKRSISFHFQSTLLNEAQDWYMAVYRLLPPMLACKNPIPPFIDIFVIALQQQPMMIRIPLDLILENNDRDTQLNIRTFDLKPVLWSLLKRNGLLLNNLNKDDIRLCWRSVGSSSEGGDGVEWITENTELIGPQLIEQKHRLELRISQVSPSSIKKSNNIIALDGLLTQKQWYSAGNQFKSKQTWYYSILYGHHIFLLDKSYYYYYKRLRQASQILSHTNIEHKHHWFSATTDEILLQQQQKKKKPWQHINHSTPHLTSSNTDMFMEPDSMTLMNTKCVIDINQVSHVQPHAKDQVTFEIHMKDGTTILYYQARNTQIMLEWVTLIHGKLKIDPLLLVGHHNRYETYQSRPENVKNILQSGLLYVKRDYTQSFQSQYCILTNNQHGGGLLIFDMLKSKKQWWCHNNNNQQRQSLSIYEKKSQLMQLNQCYVYSGDSCILDKLIQKEGDKKEPSKYYKDGLITMSGNKTSECVFVIWQIQKRHFVPNFREYLSLFKLGHRLGNRGSCWVFKARDKQERDAWVWALHQKFQVFNL